MGRQKQILELARKKGIIRAEDVEAIGISRNYLYRMHKEGLLEKSAKDRITVSPGMRIFWDSAMPV